MTSTMTSQAVSYRRARQGNPMSDWGHAMFADDRYAVDAYMGPLYCVPHDACIPIESLEDAIRAAWAESENRGTLPSGLEDADIEDILQALNPVNITDSAEAYDNGPLSSWFWENVLEPRWILAIKTQDGAIVYDPSLIQLADEDDED